MKRRLRKKKYVKEFSEYGVELGLKVGSEISEDDFEKLAEITTGASTCLRSSDACPSPCK
jgi:hypothetical protein